jgi:5-hydroxyisourate hydrolase-like protein (transthyretin family)
LKKTTHLIKSLNFRTLYNLYKFFWLSDDFATFLNEVHSLAQVLNEVELTTPSRVKEMNRNMALIFAIIILYVLNVTPFANAQPYYDAYFTSIMVTDGNGASDLLYGGTAKVYDGQLISINTTAYNNRCGVFGANLYVKMYVSDVLVTTTSEAYILKGTNMGNQLYDYQFGAKIVNYKVELWWDSSGTYYLEDEKTFSIQVVKLSVSEWLPSSLSVEKGKTTASTWSITFKNGGNDMMYGSSISIVDSSGLQITPTSTSLGNIASQGIKSTSFSVVAPNTLSTGYKTVSFQIGYNDFEGNSHVESKAGYVAVNKLGTSIVLTLTPSSVKKDASMTITARLLDGNGNPIGSQSIAFSIGATSLGSANTDSSGNAVKPYTANINAGTYVVNASYAGGADYGSSSGTSNLIVNPFTTTLTIDVPSAIQGQSVTLKATLKDENGNPIQGVSIQFQMYDGTSWTNMSSANTDSNGVASISYTPSSTGSFQVKAMFGGTANYAPSASTSANLNVGMDYTPYYVGGGIIVVIILCAIGYWVYRTRKKTAPQK